MVNDTVLIDDERHDSGNAVLRRPRNQSEAADHDVMDHIVNSAIFCCRSLRKKDLVEIPVIGFCSFRYVIAL